MKRRKKNKFVNVIKEIKSGLISTNNTISIKHTKIKKIV